MEGQCQLDQDVTAEGRPDLIVGVGRCSRVVPVKVTFTTWLALISQGFQVFKIKT